MRIWVRTQGVGVDLGQERGSGCRWGCRGAVLTCMVWVLLLKMLT